MQQSVLIITPFFAPQSHAAVFRAYKLAKYLPDFGWKPYVVTTDINYNYNEDPGLLDALPPTVEIHRARYVEPSLRGLRMALGGSDRTFKTLKAAGNLGASAEDPSIDRQSAVSSIPARIYGYLIDKWLRSPDAFWTWERPAIAKAVNLIRRHDIRVVFTSADPYTSHRIGYRLKQMTGVRWIADFRDPHTHSNGMHSSDPWVFGLQRHAERTAVMAADAVTVAAESIALILMETYGIKDDGRFHFIPTGVDEALLKQIPTDLDKPTVPYCVFSGEFLPTYTDEFFVLFAKVVSAAHLQPSGVRILFIGRREINQMRIMPFLRHHHLETYADFHDHMPQERLYGFLRDARAALMISGTRSRWWCLSAKLVDYLALRIPTIAIVPNPSEARMHLQRSGLGIFLDGVEEAAVQKLTEFILAGDTKLDIDEAYCDRFLARSQVESFVKVMEGVL